LQGFALISGEIRLGNSQFVDFSSFFVDFQSILFNSSPIFKQNCFDFTYLQVSSLYFVAICIDLQ